MKYVSSAEKEKEPEIRVVGTFTDCAKLDLRNYNWVLLSLVAHLNKEGFLLAFYIINYLLCFEKCSYRTISHW